MWGLGPFSLLILLFSLPFSGGGGGSPHMTEILLTGTLSLN